MGTNGVSRLSRLGAPLLGAAMLVAGSAANVAIAQGGEENLSSVEKEGKDLAFDRKKGNCLACHEIPGGELPGNLGPSLVGVADRLDEERIRKQIWDAEEFNPVTSMPPFGKHEILSEEEIDKITAYLMTLKY
ncbi:sulfur oxidation c-type cytochrome SoxX [Thiohalorhabdus denitrificans]|uniref:Sulfur-oxidizing protein SoxX n=1 Tax=Thiohalorhabdus denitrificans TaxID=381306 RepID=A0A1G5FFF0_9GAMM|nr:sulfur oxidation c-type cytochrome SoxX [Thiohalorhabdus denitrificans]SCY37851.1 sulfur-oxidizing protein SoxX [Thiohalorhabdus denitrificans]